MTRKEQLINIIKPITGYLWVELSYLGIPKIIYISKFSCWHYFIIKILGLQTILLVSKSWRNQIERLLIIIIYTLQCLFYKPSWNIWKN